MINLGLQRITALVQPLFAAHPASLPWKAIHVAGTNGKGSVAALLSTFLSRSGYSVGRFTSPHLIDRWDCITLDQRVVDRDLFLNVEREVRARSHTDQIGASDFEILTATAFELFTRGAVDVAVVECGLGGRLDATNVLRNQDVLISVLAKVGLDHTDLLGDTIEKITWEKAGIFKPGGVPVVVDASNDAQVLRVVRARLEQLGTTQGVAVLDEAHVGLLSGGIEKMNQLRGRALAKHQEQNLTTAWTAYTLAERRLRELKPLTRKVSGVNTTGQHVGDSGDWVQNVKQRAEELPQLVTTAHNSLRGRLEWLEIPDHLLVHDDEETSNKKTTASKMTRHQHNMVLIDGAHNPQSVHALAAYVDDTVRPRSPNQKMTWVLAAKSDKDVAAIMSILLRPGDNVVTCSFGPVDGMPWVKSMASRDLLQVAKRTISHTPSVAEAARDGNVKEALVRALKIAGHDGSTVCVAGSLYLVGDVLRLVRDG
ncbi:uncharacterized protein PV06_09904 [Exophiala oligosperma]|uniref:Mur ligase C-terminal domain-containing protein n=1 Tax=Exophiala oligosperma TaxID=215243 RepID=A0A0D2AC97_9EURO|nr:uncharacterized protein PV06_09904 [Exophiala oligosperma]KIW37926.1 hypothetical protein PV06_09904 [Exophiala oligosperma]